MSESTAVATKESAELAQTQEQLEAELANQNREETDANDIQIPLLKLGQPLTDEVSTGDASPGEFINALTRTGLGKEITFLVAGQQKGRFDHGIRGKTKARKSYGSKTVPESWADDPYKGQPFTLHPEAEETYSKRANAGEIDWGKGPRISTTYDFYGYVVGEGDEEGEVGMPVCLSLMRMNSKAAKKWLTILDAVLRGRYWDAVFTLTSEQQKNDNGNYYTINIKQGRKTTAEERQQAVTLAQVLRARQLEVVGEGDEGKPTVQPKAEGALEV